MDFQDRTEAREQAYPSFMGRTVGAFSQGQVVADSLAKDESLNRVVKLLKEPNVDVTMGAGEANGEKIGFGASVPAVLFGDLRTYAPKNSKLKMSMSVQETNRRKDETGVTATAESSFGAGGLGWGVGGRFESTVSHNSEQSRETSYNSVVDMEMEFEQSPPPLGVQMIVGCIGRVTEAAMKQQESKAVAAIEESTPEELPEAPPDPEGDAPPDKTPIADKGTAE